MPPENKGKDVALQRLYKLKINMLLY